MSKNPYIHLLWLTAALLLSTGCDGEGIDSGQSANALQLSFGSRTATGQEGGSYVIPTFRVFAFGTDGDKAGTYCLLSPEDQLLTPCDIYENGNFKSKDLSKSILTNDGPHQIALINPAIALPEGEHKFRYNRVADNSSAFDLLKMSGPPSTIEIFGRGERKITEGITNYYDYVQLNATLCEWRSKILIKFRKGEEFTGGIALKQLTVTDIIKYVDWDIKKGCFEESTAIYETSDNGDDGIVMFSGSRALTNSPEIIGSETFVLSRPYNLRDADGMYVIPKVPTINIIIGLDGIENNKVSHIPLRFDIQPMTTYIITITINTANVRAEVTAKQWDEKGSIDDSLGANPTFSLGYFSIKPWDIHDIDEEVI